jgi:outer membrane protein assembly factor BamB
MSALSHKTFLPLLVVLTTVFTSDGQENASHSQRESQVGLIWEDAAFFGHYDNTLVDMAMANGTLFALGMGPFKHSPGSQADFAVSAYEPSSGALLWTYRSSNPHNENARGIAAAEGVVLVAGTRVGWVPYRETVSIFLTALNARTGEVLRNDIVRDDECGEGDSASLWTMASQGGSIVLSGMCSSHRFIRAYDISGGDLLWEAGGVLAHGLVAEGGAIYALGWDAVNDNLLTAHDVNSGTKLWEAKLEAWGAGTQGLRLAARSESVFVSWADSLTQGIAAIDAATGSLQWQVDPGVYARTIASNGGHLLAGASGSVRAFNARTGSLLWERVDDMDQQALQVRGNRVLVAGTGRGFRVQVLDAAGGDLVWEDIFTTPKTGVALSLESHGRVLFVGGWRGFVSPPYSSTEYFLRAYDMH